MKKTFKVGEFVLAEGVVLPLKVVGIGKNELFLDTLFDVIRRPIKECKKVKVWIPKMTSEELLNNLNVSEVIFSNETTIVILNDGTKSKSTCSIEDNADPVVGFCNAYTHAVSKAKSKKEFKSLIKELAAPVEE